MSNQQNESYTQEQIQKAESVVRELIERGYLSRDVFDTKVKLYLEKHFTINSTDGKDASTSSPS